MNRIKKKDRVVVLWGNDQGKQGEVVKVYPKEGRVLVAKINMVKRHARPTQTEPGGIHEKEAPLAVSKVMLVCPKCNQPTRPRIEFLSDGAASRVCRKCGEMIA